MKIGSNLKNLRNAKGITQKELAESLNVSSQAVSRWENDEVEPDISTLSKLSEIFGVSVDHIINGEVQPKEQSPQDPIVVVKEAEPKAQVVGKCFDCGKSLMSDEPIRHLNRTFPDGHVEKATLCLDCYAARIDKQSNKPTPVPVVAENKKQIAVCHGCGKVIYEGDKFSKRRVGRHGSFHYCEECTKKHEEDLKKQQVVRKQKAATREKVAIILGLILGAIALVLGCVLLPKAMATGGAIVLAILLGYGTFAMMYCLICGSYILEVFVDVATVSIKFPGLIFSWDIDGFIWVITMKILFAVIAFLFGLACAAFAVAFAMVLSIVSWPFIFAKVRKYGVDSLG